MEELKRDSSCSRKAHAVQEEELTYSDDGVDLTLIRWMLSLTPADTATDRPIAGKVVQ